MNAFLRSHRVLKVNRELVQRESAPCWAVCVEYMEGPVASGPSGRGGQRNDDRKVDYKAMLSEGDFAVFSLLRDLRKTLAEAEGVPVYAVFTNEQLAKFAQSGRRARLTWQRSKGLAMPRSKSMAAGCWM